MIRKGLRPGFRIGMDIPDDQDGYRRVWPFRRSWVAIAILVGTLFMSAWLLGWSTAPLIMTAILLVMLFGREALKLRPGAVELFLGFPYLGLMVIYDVSKMRNLRIEQPIKKSGTSWRGTHFSL